MSIIMYMLGYNANLTIKKNNILYEGYTNINSLIVFLQIGQVDTFFAFTLS